MVRILQVNMVLGNCSGKKVGISFLSYHETACTLCSPSKKKISTCWRKEMYLHWTLVGVGLIEVYSFLGNMSNSQCTMYINTHRVIMPTLSPCLHLLSPNLRDHTPPSFPSKPSCLTLLGISGLSWQNPYLIFKIKIREC